MTTSIINGICRCCSADHPLKDLTSTYNWMGEDEIYMDMLRECFDLSIRVTPNTMGGICEVCITQLRNAYNFKKQVIVTEEMFTKKLEEESYNADIKLENKEDVDLENLEDDPNFSDYDVPIKMEELIIDEDSDEKKTKKRRNAKKCSSAKKIKTESGTSKKEGSRNNMLNCHICDEQFTTIFNVKRHLRSAHKIDKKITKKTLCDSCGKVFYNEEWLGKHLARGCERRKEMICIKCDMTFDRKSDMLKHMRIRHWSENKLWKYNCPFCVESFHSHKDHDSHLFQTHDIKIYYQDMIFDSEEDLIAWKEKLEKRDGVCFLKRTSNAGKYYHCYPQEYLGNNRIPGRVKTCPARIEWKQQEELWIATYQSKHVCEKDFRKRIKKSPKVLCPRCDVMLDKFDEFYNHLAVVHRLNISVESLSFDSYDGADGGGKKKKRKNAEESATPERLEHRVNLTAILQHSNASPFRDKTAKGFSCLYCAKYFKDIEDLRRHTAQQTEKDKINTMIDYKLSYNPIKVDITNLLCTLCCTTMNDLNQLKNHLSSVHNKTIYKSIKDIILPFRLLDGNSFVCVVCSDTHISFKNLYHHMSSHYRNYCCNKCGAGYITIAALRKHGKTHVQGNFPCAYCEKSYTSLTKKRNHEKGVHTGGWLRNKCPHCPEIFVSYYDRSEHLVRVHNETPVIYPCNACDKVYKKKYELNRHIKHHHLQQKNYMCDMCNAKFYSKRGLIDHMSRHMGQELFTCDICGKSFMRQRTLKEHLRAHEEDKRYQCEVCSKAFMQKCSLKSHMRLHQDDLDIFKEFDDVKHLIDNRDLTLKQIAAENKKKLAAERAAKENLFG